MARLNIDTGTLGNPATGDTLRTAMTKINTNFEEVFSLVGDGDNGLLTTSVTNGNIKVQPNGTGVVEIDSLQITDSAITSITTNSDLTLSANGTGDVAISSDLHMTSATPLLKFQRTDNANVPGISFLGSAGTEGASIKFDGTSGSANEIILSSFSDSTVNEKFRVQTTGAKVTALELQEDHHLVGIDLTKRCGLENNVEHLCGDFLDMSLPAENYDAVVCWLALYLIPHRDKLLESCIKILKPNGYFFAEDFAFHQPFSDGEKSELSKDFFANYIVSYSDYNSDLIKAGFSEIVSDDMTISWSDFTKSRHKAYKDNIARHTRVHNEAVVENMLYFYNFAMRYLDGGKLGGIRIYAKK